MKKSVLMTLIALVAVTMFAFGCKKEENINTDTATTDTAMSSTTVTTDTTGSMTTTDTTGSRHADTRTSA